MTTTTQDPIANEWTMTRPQAASAIEAATRLGALRVSEIPCHITPYLAAAGAEMASVAGIDWRFGSDDPPVALLRLIARVALAAPNAAGPHTRSLIEQLDKLGAQQ